MSKTVEIYGLYCPDTDELRYVGKANSATKRLKAHIQERGLSRPVNRWVRSLVESGKPPVMRVLETVPADQWEEAERRLIGECRKTSKLLNLADGGAMPSQTAEQRKKAARASLAAQRKLHPAETKHRKAIFEMSRLHARFVKDGQKTGKYFHAYAIRFLMRCYYANDPKGHAAWANL
jgi:hypothetical protein